MPFILFMKKKYWIISIILLLLTCAYSFNYFYKIEKQRKIDEIVNHQKIHVRQAVKSFTMLFEKWNYVLFFLSNDENVISLNEKGKSELEKLLVVLKGEIKAITRTDSSGRIIFTAPLYSNSIGVDISKQKHMAKILTDHRPVVSDVFNAVQGFPAIVIHYPVFNKGKFNGTIAFLLNFEQISKDVLDEIKIGKSGYAWMLSSDGIELYCPLSGHVGKSIYETSKEFPDLIKIADQMLAGKEGSSAYNYFKKGNETVKIKKIIYYQPVKINNTFWALAISYSEDEITESLTNFRNKLMVIFATIFMAGIYFSYFGLKAQLTVRTEKALIKERSLLRTLIDNLPSGVYIKDKEYRKIIANPLHIQDVKSYLKQIGKNDDINILGKTDFEVFPEEYAQQFFIEDEKVIRDGKVLLNQIKLTNDEHGKKIWLLVSKVPIKDMNGDIIGMVGIATDISGHKKTEEELIIAKEKAEESDRLKSAFLNNISHEIRTPLNAILGFTSLLKEPEIEEDKKEAFIDIINQSSNQLLLIISDIINIATIETGQVKVNLSKVNINAVMQILYEQHKGKALSKNISLILSAPFNEKDATVYTDHAKFIEILSNLIANAIKFTEKGQVSYGYVLKDKLLEFYVEDSGIGIDKKFHETIFNRFHQVESSLTTKYGGTGLGLSISKAYVEVLGGKIWLISIPNEGSTFYFNIPYNVVAREVSG